MVRIRFSDSFKLQGLFGACLQQYAGEQGFLGRHKLKMLGYIEVAMKLGRDSTIGGVAGLLKDRYVVSLALAYFTVTLRFSTNITSLYVCYPLEPGIRLPLT